VLELLAAGATARLNAEALVTDTSGRR
jgi:hypothetical protein